MLLALGITGLALHVIIFFYGRGRNGKGVCLRLLEYIVGKQLYSLPLRPEEVEKGSSDKDKRLMGKLRGMRIAFTGEAVGGNLDWTLLKLLSGGDSLIGSKLYHDDESFTPTHTLFITTNERPTLSPTAALSQRVRFVPFNADFTKSKDATLEDDLKREAPGILWKLIKTAPSIFERGIEPPASVMDATADVMDENDVAAPFIDEYLIADATAVTPLPRMEDAVRLYMRSGAWSGDTSFDRIMDGVKARWSHGRQRVAGHKIRYVGLKGCGYARQTPVVNAVR